MMHDPGDEQVHPGRRRQIEAWPIVLLLHARPIDPRHRRAQLRRREGVGKQGLALSTAERALRIREDAKPLSGRRRTHDRSRDPTARACGAHSPGHA